MLSKTFRAKSQMACGLLVAISIFMGLSSDENWKLRALAGALFLISGVGIFASMLFSRRFQFIGPKLIASRFKVRLTVEAIGRLVMLGLTIFFTAVLFTMCLDFYDLAKGHNPVNTEAIVTYVPGHAIWNWVWKDIGLLTADGKSTRYNLFFHPAYPKQGMRYQVVLLRRSKSILSLQPIEH